MTQEPLMIIAVLIDCENFPARLINYILSQLEASGKKIGLLKGYADWTEPSVKRWKLEMKDLPVETVQRFAYDKESTDIIMSVDATEILYTHPQIQGFCFISSDGDLEIPARKIKNKGLFVMGVGEIKTRKNYVKLCDEFIYINDSDNPLQMEDKWVITPEHLSQTFEKSQDANGIAQLSTFGHYLHQLIPGLIIKNTKYGSLSGLIKAFAPLFELLPDGKGGLLVKRNA